MSANTYLDLKPYKVPVEIVYELVDGIMIVRALKGAPFSTNLKCQIGMLFGETNLAIVNKNIIRVEAVEGCTCGDDGYCPACKNLIDERMDGYYGLGFDPSDPDRMFSGEERFAFGKNKP